MTTYSLRLNLKSNCPKDVTIKDSSSGLGLKISKDDSCITIDNIEALSEDDALQIGVAAANKVLDSLAVQNDCTLEIAMNSHVFSSEEGVSAFIFEKAKGHDEIMVEKKDERGNLCEVLDTSIVKGDLDLTKNRPSASYFRKAQVTDDPYERFRNLYLVVENIGILINPNLSDNELLKKTIPIVFSGKGTALEEAAKSIPEFVPTGNPFSDVAKLLYNNNRCALNHSKVNKGKTKVPFNAADEMSVKDALPLMEFVAREYINYEQNHLI